MDDTPDKPPSVSKNPPDGKKFPCPSCGASLDFDPRVRGLKCPYCGHAEKIHRDSLATIVERDYLKYLDDLEAVAEPIPGRENQSRCTGCGALVLLETKIAADDCPFCGVHLENKPVAVAGMISPEALLPFKADLREAREVFSKWLQGLWFAPSELVKVATLGKLTGVYVPYWTYDTMTYTFYDGERGDDYTDYQIVTVTDSNGNNRTESRPVVRTRWSGVSGEVQHFFDDVLVCGSNSIPQHLIDGLEPWPIGKVEPFQPAFLSGFRTERYVVGLKEGFQIAKSLIEPTINTLVRQDIGGNHQQVHDQKTKHTAITFKHLLLPLWVAVYRYHDRTFQVVVNGRTSKVVGDRPWSTFKIVRLVLLILWVIAIIVFVVSRYR